MRYRKLPKNERNEAAKEGEEDGAGQSEGAERSFTVPGRVAPRPTPRPPPHSYPQLQGDTCIDLSLEAALIDIHSAILEIARSTANLVEEAFASSSSPPSSSSSFFSSSFSLPSPAPPSYPSSSFFSSPPTPTPLTSSVCSSTSFWVDRIFAEVDFEPDPPPEIG